jgi:hypothetical protein
MAGRFTARRVVTPDMSAIEEAAPAPLESIAWTVLPEAASEPAVPQQANPLLSDKLLDAKVRLHRRLIEEINLSALEKLPEEEIRRHVQQLVSQYVLVERLALNAQELSEFISEILDEMTGLGPLEPLLKDETISDILINGHECVYVERRGVLEPLAVRFGNDANMRLLRQRLVQAGIYDPRGVAFFFIARTGLAIVLGLVAFLAIPMLSLHGSGGWLMVIVGGIAGYIGPSMYLDKRIGARKEEHRAGFPDFLDLLVVRRFRALNGSGARTRRPRARRKLPLAVRERAHDQS